MLQINLWYGDQQRFGRPGYAQRWVNLLGNVSGAPPEAITLTYRLNDGAPQPLTVGPDRRRLEGVGDFNIDLDRAWLQPGRNTVIITASDDAGQQTVRTVQVEALPVTTCALPYQVDWRAVSQLQEAVQIIDGLWSIEPAGLRTQQVGYDRIIGIGADTWTDYEIRVPITVHFVDPEGYRNPNSAAPGFGFVARWRGHTDMPIRCQQPHCGFLPSGAQGWYDWGDQGGTLFLYGSTPGFLARMSSDWKLATGVTYIWKFRVATVSAGYAYGLTVWPAHTAEPADWMLTAVDNLHLGDPDKNPASGSLLIVAHHVDVTIGTITVQATGV